MPYSPGRRIEVAERHALNRGVLAYLGRAERASTAPLSARPGDLADPYYQLGTHPDVVEYLWDTLGGTLPEDCRAVVLGTPALVQPDSGVILALGLGTEYALRLTPADAIEARAAGLEVAHHYRTSDSTLDLTSWGEGWFFCRYDRREPEWLARSFEEAPGGLGSSERPRNTIGP
jgi:hypothetical protein